MCDRQHFFLSLASNAPNRHYFPGMSAPAANEWVVSAVTSGNQPVSFVVSGMGQRLLLNVGFADQPTKPRIEVATVRASPEGGVLVGEDGVSYESIHDFLTMKGAILNSNAGVWMPPRSVLLQDKYLARYLAPSSMTSVGARDYMLQHPGEKDVLLCERPQNRRTMSCVVRKGPNDIQKTLIVRENDRYCFQVSHFSLFAFWILKNMLKLISTLINEQQLAWKWRLHHFDCGIAWNCRFAARNVGQRICAVRGRATGAPRRTRARARATTKSFVWTRKSSSACAARPRCGARSIGSLRVVWRREQGFVKWKVLPLGVGCARHEQCRSCAARQQRPSRKFGHVALGQGLSLLCPWVKSRNSQTNSTTNETHKQFQQHTKLTNKLKQHAKLTNKLKQ